MKNFLVLLREPDGREKPHSEEFSIKHQKNWTNWFEKNQSFIVSGSSLNMNGRIIDIRGQVKNEIHKKGTEIVGGFLLLRANDLDYATSLMKDCPIYEADGYAEIRELQRNV